MKTQAIQPVNDTMLILRTNLTIGHVLALHHET